MAFVSFDDLFQFVIMAVALITLFVAIYDKKRK